MITKNTLTEKKMVLLEKEEQKRKNEIKSIVDIELDRIVKNDFAIRHGSGLIKIPAWCSAKECSEYLTSLGFSPIIKDSSILINW